MLNNLFFSLLPFKSYKWICKLVFLSIIPILLVIKFITNYANKNYKGRQKILELQTFVCFSILCYNTNRQREEDGEIISKI